MRLLWVLLFIGIGSFCLLRTRRDYKALRPENPTASGKADPMAVAWLEWLFAPTEDREFFRRKRKMQWFLLLGVALIGGAVKLVWSCF